MKKHRFRKIMPDSNTLTIFGRLAGEFFIPFLIAALWTWWDWKSSKTDVSILSTGGIHFFAVAWIFSQWNRIKKQKKNEDGLADVTKNTSVLIRQLNKSTANMLGTATGGDSFCALNPVNITSLVPSSFALRHIGDYPLYDVDVRIVDLERLKKLGHHTMFENKFHFNMLIPYHEISLNLKGQVEMLKFNEVRRYNIFYVARNGSFTQLMQMQYVEGRLLYASIFSREEEFFYEIAERDYPRDLNGMIDWTGND